MIHDLRRALRRIPALAGPLPQLDPASLPAQPLDLLLRWLADAVAAGVPEPHVMTVATADATGLPTSRVVVLEDVRERTVTFATDRRSRKARDLATNPAVALSWYWQPLGRQLRVTGRAELLGPEASAEDLLSRSPRSRAAALAVRPGEPLDGADVAAAIDRAHARVEADPALVLPEWVVVAVTPTEVEVFQGDPGRAHVRVVYRRSPDGWSRTALWP